MSQTPVLGPFQVAGSPPLLAVREPEGSWGRPVLLRGFNISGAAKLDGLPCRPGARIVERAGQFLPRLAREGFNLVRLPVVWEHLQPGGPEDWDPALAGALVDFAGYAGALGFYVLVDFHQDLLSSFFRRAPASEDRGDGLPEWVLRLAASDLESGWDDGGPLVGHWAANYELNGSLKRAMRGLGTKEKVLRAFEGFAARVGAAFKDLPNVLGYEPLNEPFYPDLADHHGSSRPYSALLAAVRRGLRSAGALGSEGQTPTVCPGPCGNWAGAGLVPSLVTRPDLLSLRSGFVEPGPARDGYWLLAPHLYDPGALSRHLQPQPERYPEAVRAVTRLFGRWGTVPLIGEFGVPSDVARDRPERQMELLRLWLDLFEAEALSWCLWNFNPEAKGPNGEDGWCGERMSLAYSEAGGPVQYTAAFEMLLRPFIRRLAGPVRSLRFTGHVRADWRWEAELGEPYQPGWATEIWVPESLGAFRAEGASPREGELRCLVTAPGAGRVVIQSG